MILRMYELAAADMERLSGWPADAGQYAGPLRAQWPENRLAIELCLPVKGTGGRQPTFSERHAVMRRLVPWVARRIQSQTAMSSQTMVVRLDGRLQPGGLIEAVRYLDPAHTNLFSFTGASRLSPTEPLPPASISMLGDLELLEAVCADAGMAFEGGVRLRALSMPTDKAPAVLNCPQPDDERWSDHLGEASLLLAPSASGNSLFVIGPTDAEELRHMLVPPPPQAE